MEKILQGLQDLEGVHGSIVADAGGTVLAYRAHTVYDGELIQDASRIIAGAVDSVKLVQENWDTISAAYTDGKLLIRRISAGPGAKYREASLAVIADGRLNPSFAGVAIRVALGKVKALLESGWVPGASVGASSGMSYSSMGGSSPHLQSHPAAPHPQSHPAGHLAAHHSVMGNPEVVGSGLSWSGMGGSSAVAGSGIAVTDAASSALLTLMTKELARSVGPMAKVFVKEAVRRICPDRPFSRDYAQALIIDLERSIENPVEVTRFRQTVMKNLG